MIPLYNLNFILSIIIFAPLTESYNVFVFDKKGHIVELQEPIHIDAENTPKDMRARLQKQLEDFLQMKYKKQQHENNRRDKMRSEFDSSSLGNKSKSSPVVFSNGRYTLDFDNIDLAEVKAVTRKPDSGLFYDPNESFRDYYDFVNDRHQLPKTGKVYTKNIRSKKDNSYRKSNELLRVGKNDPNGDTELIDDLDIKKKDAKRSFKRFKVVGPKSNKKKNKHKSSKKSHKKSTKNKNKKKYSSEDVSASKRNSFESLSVEKPLKKKESDESAESEDDSFYLQGNSLVKLNSQNAGSDSDGSDGRRRLPYFMPKRFHWTQKDMKHLGYFWFNGPKGKYPEAVPLN